MDCPHCRAPLPDAAAACPACGVDPVKFKARALLAKLKAAAPAPASGKPPWLRSAVFLAALAAGACLLLYGAALVAGRRAGGPPAAAAPAASPAGAAAASAPAVAPAAPAPPTVPVRQPESDPAPQSRRPIVQWDGGSGPLAAPPPPPQGPR